MSGRYGPHDTGLPTAGADPGVPGSGLSDMVVSSLTPAVPDTPPSRSRYGSPCVYVLEPLLIQTFFDRFYQLNFSINVTSTGGTIAYINNTVRALLSSDILRCMLIVVM